MSIKSELVLLREEHAQPRTVEGIAGLVREVLQAPGAVERLIIEKNQPVRVYRWRERDLMEDTVDLDGALRNAEMAEYVGSSTELPYQTVFNLTQLLRAERVHPVCWVVGPSKKPLARWLGLGEATFTDLLFIPVQHVKTLPEETLVLAGSPAFDGGFQDINVAIKTVMEERVTHDLQELQAAGGSRHHPEVRAARAGAVPQRRRGSGQPAWEPPGFVQQRVGG